MIPDNETFENEIRSNFIQRLVKCFLDIIILAHFQQVPFSGYDVLQYLQKEFGLCVSSGTVYSIIYGMERKKLIEALSEKGKRIFKVTEKGKSVANVVASSDEMITFVEKLWKK